MTVTLETPDGRLVALRLPDPSSPVLLADVPLSCGCKVPVHVIGVEGSLEAHERESQRAIAACWECSRELGKLVIERPVLFMGEVDEGFPAGFRGRVYRGDF